MAAYTEGDFNIASAWFWDLIGRASLDRGKLREILQDLTKAEIYRFNDEFEAAAAELKDDPFVEFIDSEESEDGIDDIANWVVSHGFEYYGRVLENPSLIPARVDLGDPSDLYGVAGDVYYEKFGEPIGLFQAPAREDASEVSVLKTLLAKIRSSQ